MTKTGPSLQDRVASVMPEDAGSYRCLFPEGSAPRAIAQAVEDEDAFCLVIGVARYNSVGDFFLGTAIDLLLRRSPYPVLIAKERPRAAYEHIVIGTDLSDASKRGVEAAVRMFPQAQLHLVHAFHIPYEAWQNAEYVRKELASAAQEQCDSFTAQLDVSPECREKMTMELVEGSPLTAINKTIRKYDAHLCALTSHGYGGLRQALIGSTVSDRGIYANQARLITGPRRTSAPGTSTWPVCLKTQCLTRAKPGGNSPFLTRSPSSEG